MPEQFRIDYRIDKVNRDALQLEAAPISFELSAVVGQATLSMGGRHVETGTCGLLYFSNRLVYLTIMPLLYGTEEWEAAVDNGLDMSSAMKGKLLELRFSGDPSGATEFYIPPLEAIDKVGRFHGQVVRALYDGIGDAKQYFRISQLLPLASVKFIPALK